MRTYITVCLLAICLTLASASKAPMSTDPQYPLFERALAQVGLTPAELRIDTDERAFFGGDKYRLPFYDALYADPWRISPYCRRITDALLEKHAEMATVLMGTQGRLNQSIRLGLTGDTLAPYQARVDELGEASLATALAELERYAGRPQAQPEDFTTANYANVPSAVRDAAALLLFVMPDALEYRRLALIEPMRKLGIDPHDAYHRVLDSVIAETQEDEENNTLDTLPDALLTEQLLDNVDFQLLNTGATLLALALDRVVAKLNAAALEQGVYWYFAKTALGEIGLNGSFSNEYAGGPHYLLLIDAGGDDTYHSGAACSGFDLPLGISIDLAGDDQYVSADDTQPGYGAGVFGYGFAVDLAGNDTYQGASACLGSGIFGTGVLYDAAGDDSYSAVASAQGSGTYGTGLLIDCGGNDTYTCYQASQGYGFTLGAGLLLDAGDGNDRYIANDTDIRYASPQSAEHNVSMAQGVGNGRRADFTDGHSWAGGVGLLIDGGGSDSYACGIFGQGCAYWYGVGILADKGGDDGYYGQWYVQGAGAHFGLAVLQDDAGNDRYRAPMNQNLGAGHDFTVAWFEDHAGNDTYEGCNLSLGTGNANGIGVFWDCAGNDSYLTRGITLGQSGGVAANSLREYMLTLGLFVDGGGHDTYTQYGAEGMPPAPYEFAADRTVWVRAGASQPAMPLELGCGVDAE